MKTSKPKVIKTLTKNPKLDSSADLINDTKKSAIKNIGEFNPSNNDIKFNPVNTTKLKQTIKPLAKLDPNTNYSQNQANDLIDKVNNSIDKQNKLNKKAEILLTKLKSIDCSEFDADQLKNHNKKIKDTQSRIQNTMNFKAQKQVLETALSNLPAKFKVSELQSEVEAQLIKYTEPSIEETEFSNSVFKDKVPSYDYVYSVKTSDKYLDSQSGHHDGNPYIRFEFVNGKDGDTVLMANIQAGKVNLSDDIYKISASINKKTRTLTFLVNYEEHTGYLAKNNKLYYSKPSTDCSNSSTPDALTKNEQKLIMAALNQNFNGKNHVWFQFEIQNPFVERHNKNIKVFNNNLYTNLIQKSITDLRTRHPNITKVEFVNADDMAKAQWGRFTNIDEFVAGHPEYWYYAKDVIVGTEKTDYQTDIYADVVIQKTDKEIKIVNGSKEPDVYDDNDVISKITTNKSDVIYYKKDSAGSFESRDLFFKDKQFEGANSINIHSQKVYNLYDKKLPRFIKEAAKRLGLNPKEVISSVKNDKYSATQIDISKLKGDEPHTLFDLVNAVKSKPNTIITKKRKIIKTNIKQEIPGIKNKNNAHKT